MKRKWVHFILNLSLAFHQKKHLLSRASSNLIFIFTIAITTLLITSCNPARRLQDNEFLLNKNRYKQLDKEDISMYDITYISTHVPNKRILDIYRFNLRMYVLFDTKKERKFNTWVMKNIGEKPVILDTGAVNYTVSQIQLYLFNYGYFNAEVTKEIKIKRKKANVTYFIKGNKPYTINDITEEIEDEDIANIIHLDSAKYLLRKGDQYQSKILTQERDRITELLNNKGYLRFSKEFITFSIDTNLNCNKLNIKLIIQDPVQIKSSGADSLFHVKHIPYKIRNIEINTNFNPLVPLETYSNTSIYADGSNEKGKIVYVYNDQLHYSPRIMSKYLSFKPGDYYNLGRVNRTYSKLSDLKNFSYINISFTEVSDSIKGNDTFQYIDCKIQLKPTDKYSFTAEAKGTHTGGNLGVGLDFTTLSRNIFRGGENLSYRLGAAYEAQTLFIDSKDNLLSFNTFEFGGSIKLEIPRFYSPLKESWLFRTNKPKTVFSIGGNYQQRPDYNRFISTAYYGYELNYRRTMRFQYIPIDINIVKINPTDRFTELLSQFNRIIREQYTDHLIAAMKLNFIYDNQGTKKGNNFVYFRAGLESVGNVLNLAMKIANAPKNSSDQYTIGEIPYANYLLGDIDFRFYHQFSKKKSIAYRTTFGLGIPFTNSFSLPFEKSFFLGGANSMRGWKMRSLGPGSYSGVQNFESIGDIKFETNLEYRFPIWDYFRGAFFADAGNIWLLRPNVTLPNGEFKTSQFYKEIALDAGFGLRLDFDYFLIRFDAGVPLVDPSYIHSSSAYTISIDKTVLNFGIGYPF
jgi:outer membrane protein assembly factor BamA